jgi:putative phosphoribosyl transferase
VERLVHRFRGARAPPKLQGRTVLLIDDGMATGGTERAAVEAVRRQGPQRLVVGVGVASREALEELRPYVDDVVVPLVPRDLRSVSQWYREFPPVDDAEVASLLERGWAAGAGATDEANGSAPR